MAKKKGPPQPRKKSPEELKEEAFQAKCAEAAKAKAASAAAAAPSAAPIGIKIMNRPPSLTDLTKTEAPAGGMKKSGSAVDLVVGAKAAVMDPKKEEALLAEVAAASDIAALMTPLGASSDKVKEAAGDALKAMATAWSDEQRSAAIEELWASATNPLPEKEALRAGGAMGIAAIAASLGPSAMASLGLWTRLETAAKDKKQQYCREGAANLVGALGFYMGRAFEVHLARAFPLLLSMQSDGATPVRDSAILAAAACMRSSSYHGTGRIIPQIVAVLKEPKWTCKTGALQLLMAMCEFAPLTLYSQFPLVMPEVRAALAETHPKVKVVAETALKTLCGIVQYPEVVSMIDAVEETLIAPVAKMADCLDVMMDITFVNAVDAPPLELVVPILSRALKDRKADLRKKAAKTCGNMCTLVLHPKVLVPHVPSLLPGIQAGLVESQPEVRDVCARALAGMVQGMGGRPVYKLLPELEKLQAAMTDSPSADAREKAHKDVEELAVSEINKCVDAIKAEAEREEAASKATVTKLHSLIKAGLPEGTLAEAFEHADEVAEVVLYEAINRADGKGAMHAEASMVEGLRFLEACAGADVTATVAREAGELVASAVGEQYGDAVAPPSGEERIVDLRNIILAYPGRVLLQRSFLHMDRGHCYGLVGQNGVGKTTIMTRIAQQDIHNFPTHLKCVYVQHEVHRGVNDGESVLSFMRSQVPGESDGDISEALRSVGFLDKMINGPVVDLSGGWRMKLAIARAMLQRADILLLDEPTNHLDAASVAWLAGYIQSLKDTTVMVVSHDADFMELVVTDVIHIHDLKLTYYTDGFGNFRRQNQWLFPEDGSDPVEPPAEGEAPAADVGSGEEGTAAAAEEDPASGSSPPSGEKPYGTYDFTSQPFQFPDPGKLEGIKSKRKPVLTMSGVSFRYPGSEKDTLQDINVKLCLASRVALVGANGAGKTTLLRLLVEDLPTNPGVGEVWKHHNLRLAYVAQHSMHHLEANLHSTPIAYIQDRFGFGKDKEVENKVTIKLTPEEKEIAAQRGEIGEVLSRRKLGKTIEYEVLRTGRKLEDSQWISMHDLKVQKPYVTKLIKAFDEKMAAAASGADQRPITVPEIKKHLRDFGINDVLATGKIKNLSGGQKSRLVFAAALWSKPHLLALDEPTNYIDRETLAALAESLKTFNGGVFLISHNAAFVEEVCNEQWPVHGGTCHASQKLAKEKKGSKDK